MTTLTPVELNARESALGRYARFLTQRYGRLDLVELLDEPQPITLRQIFVSPRLTTEDLSEDEVNAQEERRQRDTNAPAYTPGEAAWDVLARERFVALSGRPGSGKSTLVQAIVMELTDERPSTLRRVLTALPVPLLLRRLALDAASTLDDLLAAWLDQQAQQAESDGLALDVPRLRELLLAPDPSERPREVLLLFDGIDEVGGPVRRRKVLSFALEALARGYRVLLTGRPAGYEGLGLRESRGHLRSAALLAAGDPLPDAPLVLHHLAPFVDAQIDAFMQAWYTLRREWTARAETKRQRFREHLMRPAGRYLRTLARRPIFLTLMAHVDSVENELPEGRALLYKRIVDLYLVRQQRHRQLQRQTDGSPMPHWPAMETRLVLGHLAHASQARGSQAEGAEHKAERRRVVWARAELLEALVEHLANGPGRLSALRGEVERVAAETSVSADVARHGLAEALLAFYLNPAGLLVEPAEGQIQFAHLSFQEYLCAEYLYGRARVDGLRATLCDKLYSRLGQPGWDEVALLLLSIHAQETSHEGHFEALTWLDLNEPSQARLFVAGVAGGELPFEGEHDTWLPAVMACALAHPDLPLGARMRPVREWEPAGLALVTGFLEAESLSAGWLVLSDAAASLGARFPGDLAPSLEALRARWRALADAPRDPEEVRAQSLLALVNDARWGVDLEGREGVTDEPLAAALTAWLARHRPPAARGRWRRAMASLSGKPRLDGLYEREPAKFNIDGRVVHTTQLPVLTGLAAECDCLLPLQGPLWRHVAAGLPIDAWLLQGEAVGGADFFLDLWTTVGVLITLSPREKPPARARLSLGLYQVAMQCERSAFGPAFDRWSQLRSQSQLLSRSLSRSRSLSLSLWRSLWRSQSLSQSLSRSQSQSLWRSLSRSQSQSLWRSLWRSQSDDKRQRVVALLERATHEQPPPDSWFAAASRYAERWAANDWFDEQAEDPDLMRRRGLRPGEPLPRAFGFFDADGHPLDREQRDSWVRLRAWLDDDDALLAFFFPETGAGALSDDERADLIDQLALLRTQPWSPQSAVDALLEDWPEDEPERDVSLAAAERVLMEETDKALAALEAEGHPMRASSPKT